LKFRGNFFWVVLDLRKCTNKSILPEYICLVESFYSVKYGLSIIMSNVRQIILAMKTKKNTGVSREMIFQKQFILAFYFPLCPETILLDYWEKTKKKHENQQLFDGVEVLDYCTFNFLSSCLQIKLGHNLKNSLLPPL